MKGFSVIEMKDGGGDSLQSGVIGFSKKQIKCIQNCGKNH